MRPIWAGFVFFGGLGVVCFSAAKGWTAWRHIGMFALGAAAMGLSPMLAGRESIANGIALSLGVSIGLTAFYWAYARRSDAKSQEGGGQERSLTLRGFGFRARLAWIVGWLSVLLILAAAVSGSTGSNSLSLAFSVVAAVCLCALAVLTISLRYRTDEPRDKSEQLGDGHPGHDHGIEP